MFKRKDREKIEKFSIRKFKVGVGSALIALSFVFVGGGGNSLLVEVSKVGAMFGSTTAYAFSLPPFDVPNAELITTNHIPDNEPQPTIYTEDSANDMGTNHGPGEWEYEGGHRGGRVEYTYRDLDSGEIRTITRTYSAEPRRVRVAANDEVETSYTEPTTVYQKDSTRPKGSKDIVVAGTRGVTEKRTHYRVNSRTGLERAGTSTREVIAMVPTVIKVAAQDEVVYSKRNDDIIKTTTTYDVNERNGKLTPHETVEVYRENGAKNTVEVIKIPSPKRYEKDANREVGQLNKEIAGTEGTKTVTTTYTVNPKDGSTTANAGTPVVVDPTPTIVQVPAKDKVVYSKKNDDIIKTTTSYTVNPDNGELTPTDKVEIFKQNGAKDKVVVTPIPKSKHYEKDPNRAVGTPDVEEAGQDGSSTVTTTYTVNPQDGSVVANEGQPVVVQPRDTVVKVGAKDKVDVTPIKSTETIYEKDETKDFGTPNVEEAGVDGTKTVTTTYEVNATNGTVTPTVGEPVVVQPKPKVVKVGGKTKVVYSKNGDDIVKTTTEYEVDRNTGNVTPHESTEVFKKDGAKDKVEVTKIPSPKKYVKDDTRDFGDPNIEEAGQEGSRTVVTKYTVNEADGGVTPNVQDPIVVEPTETIVKVAAKDSIVYSKKGDDIIKTVTKYDVNPTSGEVTPNATEEIFKKDGAKDTVEVTTIPSPRQYQKDDTREVGTPNEELKGKDGTSTVTTTYTVNPKDGSLIPNIGEPVVVDPTVTIIKVGAKTQVKYLKQGDDIVKKTISYEVNKDTGELIPTETVEVFKKDGAKDKVEVEVIPTFKTYVKDGEREVGTPDVITEGKDGSKTTTTTYEVNEQTGEVIEHKGEPVIVAPVPTVVSVGAKDKVIVKDRTDGAKEKETTKYDVDKDTGKLTENVSTELLSSKGNEAPPVVQPEEFNGAVNGPDAPVSEELPVLKVGIIKDTEGNVIDVIKVDEDPKEIEGYTNTGKVETDKDGNKVYTYEKNATSSNGTELPPVIEELPVLKVGIIKDTEGNVIDVIKVDEEPKEIDGYINTGKVETDKDGNKVYIYEKVKQEKQKEEPKEIDTENPVVEKEAPALTKETKLPKTTSVQGSAELLGFLLGSLSLKSRKKQD